MVQIVYVKEYQPSSAALQLGDPIYGRSVDDEHIRIGAPNWLILIPFVGLFLWLVTRE